MSISERDISALSIAVVTHEYFRGSAQELKDFLLQKKVRRLLYIAHTFHYAAEPYSYSEYYVEGRLVRKWRTPKLFRQEFLMYFINALFAVFVFFRTPSRFDYYVGANSFNALIGVLMKFFGRVHRTVFFTIDYIMEKRFSWELLNVLYRTMDRSAFFLSDVTWNVSGRMSKARLQRFGEKTFRRVQIVVPIGVSWEEAGQIIVDKRPCTLVYSGSVDEEFGVDLIIESAPILQKLFPALEIRIIGTGPLEKKLRLRARELGVEHIVNFFGYIDTTRERRTWLSLMKESTLGLAPYPNSESTYKQFSDVTKPKDYLGCGLPVVITNVVPISEDVKKYNLGRVVDNTVEAFVAGVKLLLENEKAQDEIKSNISNYVRSMTWKNIFLRAFAQMNSFHDKS